MGLFDKKISLGGIKDKLVNSAADLSESVRAIDAQSAFDAVKARTVSASQSTARLAGELYDSGKDKALAATDGIREFDYSTLRDKSFYQEKFSEYSALGAEKIESAWKSTFEVDKSTQEMVEDVRRRLPVPAQTMDDIFEQCRQEALRRAVAAFALGGIMQSIDDRSADKYNNLSENYNQFKTRSGHHMTDDINFSNMKTERAQAQQAWTQLEDGYNRATPLDPFSADIEHVVAKKELYDDWLIRLGTSDDEFYSVINSADNLVFADASLNSSMQDKDIHRYLEDRGRVDADNPNLVHVDIRQKDGLVKTVTVNKEDVEDAYQRAKEKQQQHRHNAVQEIGLTMAKTGATMALQQITGMIVVETIDIFIDEMRTMAKEGKLINSEGWIKNSQLRSERIKHRLAERFEQRQLWAQARVLGIESGLAGALSVIPQILISLLVKMPSFVLAIVRESTLSVVRCVRVLAGNDADKYQHLKIILAGAASAIVGVYVGRVISNALTTVPLLNKFNRQITDVLTGLLVTGVPLIAIYTFERNKNRLTFWVKEEAGQQADEAIPPPQP